MPKIQGSYYITFVLALHTGMRIGEVLALQWDDVNFENKTIHVQRTLTLVDGKYELGETKTEASNRMIPMTEELMEELLEYRNHKKENPFDLLICTRNKDIRDHIRFAYSNESFVQSNWRIVHLDPPRYRRIIRSITRQPISGANAKVVSKLLGHTNVSTTLNIYTYVYLKTWQLKVTEMLGNVLRVVKMWSVMKLKKVKPHATSDIMHL